jgi:hypothetical protein
MLDVGRDETALHGESSVSKDNGLQKGKDCVRERTSDGEEGGPRGSSAGLARPLDDCDWTATDCTAIASPFTSPSHGGQQQPGQSQPAPFTPL